MILRNRSKTKNKLEILDQTVFHFFTLKNKQIISSKAPDLLSCLYSGKAEHEWT